MGWWIDLAEKRGPVINSGDGDGRPGELSDKASECRGAVLHIADGYFLGTLTWQNDPDADVSSQFVIAGPRDASKGIPDGKIAQCVDTDEIAWTQRAGNGHWLSIECSGFTGDALSPAQIESCARILARGHQVYGYPLQLATSPSGYGLGHHSMGAESGANWGHDQCLPLDATEVLTPTGWLPLADATTDSEVASLAVDSGILEFGHPTEVVTPYIADLVNISGFEMTADHRLYIQHPDGSYKVIQAGDVSKPERWPSLSSANPRMPTFGELNPGSGGVKLGPMRFLVKDDGLMLTSTEGRKGVGVGCLTTANDTLLIRQNGRVSIVGNCPGDKIKAQKPQILARAIAIVGAQEDGMAFTEQEERDLVFTLLKADGKAIHYRIDVLHDLVVELANAVTELKAQRAGIVADLLAASAGPGGLSEAQLRAIFRSELDSTKLAH